MPLSVNAYGSVAQVAAYVKHLCNASGTFDTTTKPTLTEVEQFIEQRSASLNACLAEAGYIVPVTTPSTATTLLGYYAAMGAAGDCELSQRSAGYSEETNRRENKFLDEFDKACDFIKSGAFAALGSPQSSASPAVAGLYVGGRTRTGQNLRPIFGRTTFGNNPTTESGSKEPGYTEE